MTHMGDELPEEEEERMGVFDSGGYSEANMKSYNEATIWWISRVPETSTAAKRALKEAEEEPEQWQPLSDGPGEYEVGTMKFPQANYPMLIGPTPPPLPATHPHMDNTMK